MMNIGILFILLGIAVIVFDLHTVNLVTPVGAGFIGFGATYYFLPNYGVAVTVGIVVGVVTAYFFFKWGRRGGSDVTPPIDDYLGKVGRVVEIVDGTPVVEVEGNRFYVANDVGLKVGDRVVVKGFDGIKVVVEKE